MDIQTVLQHVFGFIGIFVVIKWLRDLIFAYFNKPKHRCKVCGCTDLSSLRSLNVKKCTSCGYEMEWNLDPGQLPLVRSNRMVKKK